MEQTKRAIVKRPNALLYHITVTLLRPYLHLRYGFKIDCSLKKKMKEPFVLLANHSASVDFLFAFCAMRPFKMNAVVSTYFFGNGFLAKLLNLMGCIPKTQFLPDTACIRAMRGVIMRGGSLLIFPEGEVNGYGINDIYPEGIERLCRMLGVPVYMLKIQGSYLSSPKWAASSRRGRVEAVLQSLFTTDDFKSMSDPELNERISLAIAHDESAWQRINNVPFKGKDLAENIHSVLYLCPRCGREFTLTGKGNELSCSACGNSAVLNEYGSFQPVRLDDKAYGSVSEWIRVQRKKIEDELSAGEFKLEAPCYLQLHKGKRTLKHVNSGEGTVRLTAEGLTYEGTREQDKDCLFFSADDLFKLPYDSLNDFEIPNTGETVAIAPKEKRMIAKFVQAMPIIREARGSKLQ